MSQRLAEATSRLLARRSPRRGFLAKTAVVGSAVVAAPAEFLLKPKSAYAAICSCAGSSCDCGALCCDGYTEFCCQIYGTNGCPPGSLYGGWWKVDNSTFCNGESRYYMDCHNPCGGCGCGGSGVCSGSCNGTPCGCGSGDCGNRRAGCNHFRYGQCNQQLACVGPIICRVVTCTEPWVLEPNCTQTVRYDYSTAFHNRPCLQGATEIEASGALDRAGGRNGRIRVSGWAVDPDRRKPVEVSLYIDGDLVRTALADKPRPDVAAAFPELGHNLGYRMSARASSGSHRVCVYAGSQLLGCTDVSVTARELRES